MTSKLHATATKTWRRFDLGQRFVAKNALGAFGPELRGHPYFAGYLDRLDQFAACRGTVLGHFTYLPNKDGKLEYSVIKDFFKRYPPPLPDDFNVTVGQLDLLEPVGCFDAVWFCSPSADTEQSGVGMDIDAPGEARPRQEPLPLWAVRQVDAMGQGRAWQNACLAACQNGAKRMRLCEGDTPLPM